MSAERLLPREEFDSEEWVARMSKYPSDVIDFIIDAYDCGIPVYTDRNHFLSVVYPTDAFGDKIVGILMGVYQTESKVCTWLAYENLRSSYGTGEYDPALGCKGVAQKAMENANMCNFCGRDVGFKNLRPIAFADKSCPDCYAEAKRQYEFPGWCD